MSNIRFSWEKGKNKLNKRRHGVSFEEARAVFYDDNAIEFSDPDHSEEEHRLLMLGLSDRLRVLMVSHCCRENSDTIRIISVRKATKKEKRSYEESEYES